MQIAGLQKLTLLDFPGKVACTVFTGGCNFRCPFCHNAQLVLLPDGHDSLDTEEFFTFLGRRQGILDGVCVTGGEPLLHPELEEIIKIADGMQGETALKITTNGTLLSRRADEIISAAPHKISISVHSFEEGDADAHAAYIRAIAAFAKKAAEKGVIAVLRLWNEGGQNEKNGEILSFYSESIQNLQTIKAFDITKRYVEQMKINLQLLRIHRWLIRFCKYER